MTDLALRSLRPEDLDRVSEIESRIADHPRRSFLEKRFAAAAAAPDRFFTCAAMDGGKLAGYGFARLQEGEFGVGSALAVLDVIGVDPGAQGRGIGKAVMAEMERRMRGTKIEAVRTQVAWADQAMLRFFASAGFLLAPCRIIERDTSPLLEEPSEESFVETDAAAGRVRRRDRREERETLSRDRFLIRSLKESDLSAVVRIDSKFTGLDRSAYYGAKFREMLIESGIRVSLVAEDEGVPAGFIMARVDFGEFGKVEKTAAIDTVGVHPAYGGSGIGNALLSQLLLNLATLQVESVLVQVAEENFRLHRFLHARGFVPSQRLVLTKPIA